MAYEYTDRLSGLRIHRQAEWSTNTPVVRKPYRLSGLRIHRQAEWPTNTPVVRKPYRLSGLRIHRQAEWPTNTPVVRKHYRLSGLRIHRQAEWPTNTPVVRKPYRLSCLRIHRQAEWPTNTPVVSEPYRLSGLRIHRTFAFTPRPIEKICGECYLFSISSKISHLIFKDTYYPAETYNYYFLCPMSSQILCSFLRIYRCYNIIHSIIRGCELVLVSINRLIYVLHFN